MYEIFEILMLSMSFAIGFMIGLTGTPIIVFWIKSDLKR